MSDLILYTSDDGQTQMRLRVEGKTVWLSQMEIAELFLTTKNNVSIHTEHIFEEGELTPEATVKQSLTVEIRLGRRNSQRSDEQARHGLFHDRVSVSPNSITGSV